MVRLTAKIHEVIVTTKNADGTAHHAPMGVSEVNGYFQIKPFKPSTTYNNLMRHVVLTTRMMYACLQEH